MILCNDWFIKSVARSQASGLSDIRLSTRKLSLLHLKLAFEIIKQCTQLSASIYTTLLLQIILTNSNKKCVCQVPSKTQRLISVGTAGNRERRNTDTQTDGLNKEIGHKEHTLLCKCMYQVEEGVEDPIMYIYSINKSIDPCLSGCPSICVNTQISARDAKDTI